MKRILILFTLLASLAHSQDPRTAAARDGSNVSEFAAQWRTATGASPLLSSGPVTSNSSGVSSIADAALSIAKTNGLQTALDGKATAAQGTLAETALQDADDVNAAIEEDPAASREALDLDDATTLAKAGKPSRLWRTLNRMVSYRGGTKPAILSVLTVGDSWAMDVSDYAAGLIGRLGGLTGPNDAQVSGGATKTTGRTEYGKSPWGMSVVLDSAGEYSIWGTYSGGVASAGRFANARFLTVHYEAVNGGGTVQVQYEDRTGAWQTATTIDTNNSGASTYTVWESSVLANVESPRVRLNWVSGAAKIYAAGATATSQNNPDAGTSRAGRIGTDVSYGGSTAVEWDATPQAAWTAMLGWLKPDIVIVRERRESDLATWEVAIDSLVSKIRTARPATDFIFIGSHPTTEEMGAANDRATDAFLKTYCEENGHLFVDARAFFPDTYADSNAIGFQEADGVHQSTAGKAFLRSIIWQHLTPIQRFIQEADTTTRNGPWLAPGGVQTQFFIEQDGNVDDAYFGTVHKHRGTTSPNPGIQIAFKKRDTTQVSEGFQWTYGGQPFWQMDSANRHLVSSTTLTLARTLGGTMEFMSGQTGRHALRVSGVAGQTANIFEVRTGAAYNASGTLTAGYSPTGLPFALLSSYANDAAADADAALPSGGFYKITGSRAIFQKP